MKSTIGFVLLVSSIVVFAPEHIVRLVTHDRTYAGVAWAQDASDAQQEGDISELAMTPPNLQGTWSGTLDDNSTGSSPFTMDIFQNRFKLKGEWTYGVSFNGTFKGRIAADGMSVALNFKKGKCRVIGAGVILNAPPGPADAPAGPAAVVPTLSGSYTSKHCNGVTSGSYSLTLQ